MFTCYVSNSLTGWHCSQIGILKQEQKCDCRHKSQKLKRLVGKTMRICLQAWNSAIVFSMGAELKSHNFLSAISFLVHPLESCSQMALFPQEMGFSFLPNGSNDHKNFEAHLLDQICVRELPKRLSSSSCSSYHRIDIFKKCRLSL